MSRPSLAPVTRAFERELAVAVAAARAAATIQVERYERLEHIVKKSAKDVVTEADHRSEEAIIGIIRDAFPGDAILAEESGHSESGHSEAGHSEAGHSEAGSGPADGAGASAPVGDEHRIWIIDPLDGTVNYAAGIPHFCTSVGFASGGRPAVGVVIDPMRDEVFSAVAGQGAHLDGRPIHASTGDLGDGVISLALPPSGFSRIDRAIRTAVRVPRSMGSAALGLAWTGNGRFDAFIQWRGLSLWDLAAAGLIAEEAGSTVTSVDGSAWFDLTRATRSTGLLAAPPAHHATLLGMLRGS